MVQPPAFSPTLNDCNNGYELILLVVLCTLAAFVVGAGGFCARDAFGTGEKSVAVVVTVAIAGTIDAGDGGAAVCEGLQRGGGGSVSGPGT